MVIFSGLLLLSHAFNIVATVYLLRSAGHAGAGRDSNSSLCRVVIKETTIGGLLVMALAGTQIAFGERQTLDTCAI